MSTYSSSLNHIVFATKNRKPCIPDEHRERIIQYMWSTCKNWKCEPFAINGTSDHMHILISLHPSVSVSNLVKTIKTSSNSMIKENLLCPGFTSWQEGFGHFACAVERKNQLVDYIENQKQHHAKFSSKDEIIMLLVKYGIEYDPKYLI